ncbi:hypothetical protein B0H66DRAFT_621269 [Apodospora peruviana]|uniref:Uncharacterized protein n=1 Tax=Apodospora peruviana TaxID=516989 RepID=A0AAE0IF31_9PEZI|nr:hypothetical protein B0H66DRAFT_621269 [Apodospora peruviana]
MFSQIWTCALILFIVRASCFTERTAPFHMLNAMTTPLSATNGSLLDPCVNSQFQAPVYQLRNMTVEEGFGSGTTVRFRLTLVDVANWNRTIRCDWYPDSWADYQRLQPVCHLVPGPPSRYLGLLSLSSGPISSNDTRRDKIHFLEYYFCDIGSDASYPEVAQSRVDIVLDTKFQKNRDNTKTFCPISTSQLPLTVTGQWQPRGSVSAQAKRLQPRPTFPDNRGFDSPPSKDCTELSLTYPDWSLSDLVDDSRSLTFTLAGRSSGSVIRCSVQTLSTDEVVAATCSPQDSNSQATRGIGSRSNLTVTFRPGDRGFFIQEDWTCGDTKGLSSTNFTAIGNMTITSPPSALPRNTTNIKGSLVQPFSLTPTVFPPPPNANTPSCTAQSNNVSDRPTWGMTHFLYKVVKHTLQLSAGLDISNPDIQQALYPTNKTLEITLINYANNLTITCTFDVRSPLLDNPDNAPTGWFACPPITSTRETLHSSTPYPIETYFLFNRTAASLQINQTYYCSDIGTPYRITATGHTYPGAYPTNGGLLTSDMPRIICGDGSNTARNLRCPDGGFNPVPKLCDLFASVTWCSLDSNENGDPNGGIAAGLVATAFNQMELAPDAFISPDPTNTTTITGVPRKRSCTAASLGNVKWTLHPKNSSSSGKMPFSSTIWPLSSHDVGSSDFVPSWEHTDTLPTRISFDLTSSVFTNDTLPMGGTGRINAIGTISETNDFPLLRSSASVNLTPWSWDSTWDEVNAGAMRSYVFGTDRLVHRPWGWEGQTDEMQVYFGGWDFYNALEWSLKVDLVSGYGELGCAWYCDDKDAERP